MPWLTPGSNDTGGVLHDWRQPSCLEMVEITGLITPATATIGGLLTFAGGARNGGSAP